MADTILGYEEKIKKRRSTSSTVYCSDKKLIPRIKEVS